MTCSLHGSGGTAAGFQGRKLQWRGESRRLKAEQSGEQPSSSRDIRQATKPANLQMHTNSSVTMNDISTRLLQFTNGSRCVHKMPHKLTIISRQQRITEGVYRSLQNFKLHS